MLTVQGLPSGARGWRARVAAAAVVPAVSPDGLVLAFVLPAGRWVDLDTLVEATLAGLRDAGAVPARYARLDAIVATKADGPVPGARVTAAPAAGLARRRPPGPPVLLATTDRVPRPGRRDAKRAWRDVVAGEWAWRPPLTGPVWADVVLRGPGSLLGPVEVSLDALEPVLGRDPRGRDWQEFFPNDHVIGWLRVRRVTRGPALRLTLGPVGGPHRPSRPSRPSPSNPRGAER